MQTRSQTRNQLTQMYEVNIDFDGASIAWRENKKSTGNGCYKYICCEINTKQNKCGRLCITGEKYCRTHYKQFARSDIV